MKILTDHSSSVLSLKIYQNMGQKLGSNNHYNQPQRSQNYETLEKGILEQEPAYPAWQGIFPDSEH
jgi:hypothetical protein